MKSPFPGMDPYLEPHWRDVHQKLVTYVADTLQPGLPNDLVARTEQRIFVNSPSIAKGYRELYPDVRVIGSEPLPFGTARADSSVAVAEPLVIELYDEPMTESFAQVLEAETERVVTVVEVLSATNKKPGDGSPEYVQKQVELAEAGIGLVEIDLLRGGRWVVRVPERRLGAPALTPYRVCVTRGWEPHRAIYCPLPLRSRLPTIRVPLRETDHEVTLDFQPLLDRAYENGRYASLDYRKDPDPPLAGEDAAWADGLLRAAGRRA